ncbi:uncharacterized protein LOC131220632 [Magnolia sinica]|uniref:uncharacterized protein LOC131220632 n=1 Tax=Magnolia sinica TaxID=86752 RepID=UPI00265AD2A4|nr:uncharacterized protein LOC131220632 [Magnolia sinica]
MKMSTSDHHHSSFIDQVPTTSQVGQSSDSSASTPEGGIHNRRFRGPTVISEVANLPPNKQLNISWNKYGQPIGHKYSEFTRWLGILSRNGRLAPIDHDSWHHVPLSNKNEIWNEVKIKWNIDEERRNWVMKSIRASWKEWKKRLKKEHYKRYLTNEE